jgi:coenzyme Q-binding protein COQ10
MTKVNVTRKVKCSADEAYAIISDVGSYKSFLPFVKESRITAPVKIGTGIEQAAATLRVRYRKIALDETFTSKVEFDKPRRTISMESASGPLKHLNAMWTIKPVGARDCELTLESDLALKSRTLQFLLSGMIDYLVRKLFTAFEARASALHEPASA